MKIRNNITGYFYVLLALTKPFYTYEFDPKISPFGYWYFFRDQYRLCFHQKPCRLGGRFIGFGGRGEVRL